MSRSNAPVIAIIAALAVSLPALGAEPGSPPWQGGGSGYDSEYSAGRAHSAGCANPGGYLDTGSAWHDCDSNHRWGGHAYVGDAYGASKPIYETDAVSHSTEGFVPSTGDRPVTVVTRRRARAAMPWEGYYGGRSYDWYRKQ